MPKTIVVPLDGSEFAERALPPAATLARRTGARVVMMTNRIGGVVDEPERYLTDAAAEHAIPGAEVAVTSDRSVVAGVQALTEGAACPVVCMSTHGRTRVVEYLLGSMAEALIRRVGVPLLLVGPNTDPKIAPPFESVLVCTDGTAMWRAIVWEVASWIRELRLRAWVVQVVATEARRALDASEEEPTIDVGAVRALAEEISRNGTGINWDVRHHEDAAGAIVDYARDVRASLIAMATHGRTGLARLTLGSVAASVVHGAPCPVLVVRPQGLPQS